MRALPRMTVTAVCDAEEMTRLMDATLDWPHPIYIRLGKGGDPVISKPERGFAIGKAIDMIDGETGRIGRPAGRHRRCHHAGAQGGGLAGGRRHPLPPAACPHRQAARRRRHRRCREPRPGWSSPSRSTASSAGWAAPSSRPCRTGSPAPLPPLKRLGIPDKFAEHYGSQQKLMEDCELRCQEHRPDGAQAPGGARVGEQHPQFLARRGARAGRRLRARRLCHHPGRIARRPRSDSRPHGRYRRVLPQAAAARGQGRVPRPHPRQGRHPAPQRSAPRGDPRDERGAVDAAVLLQHRAPGARDPGRQRAGHAASHQSQHPASRRRQLAAAGPCRRLGRRFAVRSRPVDSVRQRLRHEDDVHPAARQGCPLSGADGRAEAEVGRGALPHHRTRPALARHSLRQRPAVHAERHARQHRQPGSRRPGGRPTAASRACSRPYHDKKLGEFFEPILVRPATSIGASYRLPSVA